MGQGASGSSGSNGGGDGSSAASPPRPTHRRGGRGGTGGGSSGGGSGGGGGSDVLAQLTRQARFHRRDSLASLIASLDSAESAPPAREVVQFPLLPSPPSTLLEKALALMQRGDVFTKYSYATGSPKMVFVFFSTGASDAGVHTATSADFEFGNLYWNRNHSDRDWEQWVNEEDQVARKERRAVLAAARGEDTPDEQQEHKSAQSQPQPQPVPAGYPFPVPASYPFGGAGPAPAAYPFPSPAAYPFGSGGGGGGPTPSAAAYPFAAPPPPRPLERSKSRYARCALRSIALVSVIQVNLGAERTAITAARAALPVVAQDPWRREEESAMDPATATPAAAAASGTNGARNRNHHLAAHASSSASSAGRYSGSTAPPLSPSHAAAAAAALPLDPQYPTQAPGFPSHALSQGFGRWTQAPWVNVLSYRQAQKRRRERRKQRRRVLRDKRLAGMPIAPEDEVSSDSDDDGWILAGNTGSSMLRGGSLGDDDDDDEEDLPTYTYRPPPLSHCMSIATPDRTLDLVARDASTRDVWAYGLRWLASRTERYLNHDPGLGPQETQHAQRMSVAEALGLTQAMRERIQKRRDQKGLVGRIKQVGKVITRGVGGGGGGSADEAQPLDDEENPPSRGTLAYTTPPRHGSRPGGSTDEFKSADAHTTFLVRPGLDRMASVESGPSSARPGLSRAASIEMARPGFNRVSSIEMRPGFDRTASMESTGSHISHSSIAPAIAPLFGSRYPLVTAPRTIASRDSGCEITISARHLTMAGGSSTIGGGGTKSPLSTSASSSSPSSPGARGSSNFSPCILLYGLQRKYVPGVTAMSAEKFYASLRTSRPTSSGSEIRGVGLALDERVVFLGKTERVGKQDCVAYASFRATNSSAVPASSSSAEYGAPLSLSPSHPNFVTTLHLSRLDDFDEFHFVCHDASEMDALENAMLARSSGAAEGEGGAPGSAKKRGSILAGGGGTGGSAAAGVLSPRMLRASLISSPLGLPGNNSMADQLRSFSQGLQNTQAATPSSPQGKQRRGLASTGDSGTCTPGAISFGGDLAASFSSHTSLFTLHSLQACPVVGWLRLKVDDLLLNMGRELVAPLGVPGQPPSVALLTKHFLPPPPTLQNVRALASASAAAAMMGRGSMLQQNLNARGSVLSQAGEWGAGATNDLAAGSSDMFVKDSEGRTLVTDAMLDAYKVAVLDREARRDARQKVAQAAAARVARHGGSAAPTLMRQTSLQHDQSHSSVVAHNITVRSQVSPLLLLKIRHVAPAPSLLQGFRSGSGMPRSRVHSRNHSRNNSNAHEFLAAAAEVTAAAELAAATEAAEREAKHAQRMKHRTPLIYPPGHQRAQSHEEVRAQPRGAASSSRRRRHSWSGFDAAARIEKVLLARPPLPQSDHLGEPASPVEDTTVLYGGSISFGDASYRDTDRGGGGGGSSSSNSSSLASTNRTMAAAMGPEQQQHHVVQIEDLELDLDDDDDDEAEDDEDQRAGAAAPESSVSRSPLDSPSMASAAARLFPQRAQPDPQQRRGREAPAHSPFPDEALMELAERKSREAAAAAAAAAAGQQATTQVAAAAAPLADAEAARPASPSSEPLRPVGANSPVLLASPSAVQGRSGALAVPTAAVAAAVPGSAASSAVVAAPSSTSAAVHPSGSSSSAFTSPLAAAPAPSSSVAVATAPAAAGPQAAAAPAESLGSDDLIASLQARMRKLQEASKLRADAQRAASNAAAATTPPPTTTASRTSPTAAAAASLRPGASPS